MGALPGIAAGTLVPQPQDEALATYARKLNKGEALIDWTSPALAIERQVRAFNPWPVAETRLDGEALRVWRARAIDGSGGAAGTVVAVSGDGVDVATAKAGCASSSFSHPDAAACPPATTSTPGISPGPCLGRRRAAPSPPRAAAACVVAEVAAGRSLADALPAAVVPEDERALLAELAYGTCRWFQRLDFFLARLLERQLKPRDADLKALLLATATAIVCARSAAEMPVVTPCAASIETVKAVPYCVPLRSAIGGKHRRSQRSRVTSGRSGRGRSAP